MVPVLLIVSMLAFGLLYVLPGYLVLAILGANVGNQQTYLALRHDLGLDQPLYVQYRKLARDGCYRATLASRSAPARARQHGAHGSRASHAVSRHGRPSRRAGVGSVRGDCLGPQTWSPIDSLGTIAAMGGVAIPSFWQALLLVYIFAVLLHWVPPSGFTSPFVDPGLSVRMLILPAIVLGTHAAAVIMRQGRSALMEVLEQDYVTTARSKGLHGRS